MKNVYCAENIDQRNLFRLFGLSTDYFCCIPAVADLKMCVSICKVGRDLFVTKGFRLP